MRRLAVPIVLTLVIAALFIFLVLPNVNLTPAQASAEGRVVDDLLNLEFAIMAAIFVLCMVFFFYSIFVFRRKRGQDEYGETFHGNTPLEIAWTIVPLAIVLSIGFYTAGLLRDISDASGYDLEVRVTASQWSWRFDYPDTDITSTELVLPVNQKVLFTMNSTDVIHSFWVPEFRIKQDLVPGLETQLVITPTEVGEYTLRCAEICGLRHAYMLAPVRVLEQEDYQAWAQEHSTAPGEEDPVARGMNLAAEFGCTACHSVDGSIIVGPSWLGLFGSSEEMEGDITVEVDEEYLRESILDPSANIVEDFPDAMPKDYAEKLSNDQIDDIIAYIKSLGE